MKLRHKLELVEWYRMGTSVSWLRGGGTYGKKSPRKVYGGGTLAESQYLRYYNGITKVTLHYHCKLQQTCNGCALAPLQYHCKPHRHYNDTTMIQ